MQVERERYVTTDVQGSSLETLIEKFNNEHPGFDIQIPNAKSRCIIKTVRNMLENEEGIIIKNDRSKLITDKGDIPMPDSIEIE